jgi:hypothetical protein
MGRLLGQHLREVARVNVEVLPLKLPPAGPRRYPLVASPTSMFAWLVKGMSVSQGSLSPPACYGPRSADHVPRRCAEDSSSPPRFDPGLLRRHVPVLTATASPGPALLADELPAAAAAPYPPGDIR